MDANTPLWQLTIGELQSLIRAEIAGATQAIQQPKQQGRHIVKGNINLCKELGIKLSTLNLYKRKGMLDGTYKQIGRTILWDIDKVIEIQNKKRK